MSRNRDWFGNALMWIIERTTKNPIVYIVMIIVIFVLVSYGAWHLKRWFNWELGYSNDVKMAVCEMVKPEMLKDPSVCD